ncbi:MAG: MBL fold metallo-hydrolase [Elusimicrobiota bacterium]
MEKSQFEIRIVFNNISDIPGFKTSWGNSLIVKNSDLCLLFDTGNDGDILLYNLEKAGINPLEINAIVLSHNHNDHTGGVWKILSAGARPKVFLPNSFPLALKKKIKAFGLTVKNVRDFGELYNLIYSTGEMESRQFEQGLILKTEKGPVLLTGCAHPGIEKMAEKCRSNLDIPYLICGGFHLKDNAESEIKKIVRNLYDMGIKKVSPNHCSGEIALKEFSSVWGNNFIKSGCGTFLKI